MRTRTDNLRSFIARHRIPAFLLVTFGWTLTVDAVYYWFGWWSSLPIYINTFPRQWGLPMGAVVVAWASNVPLREWLGRVFQWRFPLWLVLGVVALPLVIDNIQPVIAALGGGSLSYSPPAPLHLLFVFFLLNVFLLGGVEEFGWRGFLQPEFQEQMSVLTAGLAVGVFWWAWHLPLFLGHPNFTFEPLFMVQYFTVVISFSTVLGALVNVTDGGVIPAVVMHAALNVGSILQGSGGTLDGILLIPLVVGSGAWWLVVAVLVGLHGRSMVPKSVIEPLS